MPPVLTEPARRPPPRGVGKLLRKAFLLTLPFSAVVGSYLVLDPFQVLYHYDTYATQVILNRDYISTQLFVDNYPQQRYQSFILGNSRTMAFTVRDWAKYTHDLSSFHYDAFAESLFGVWKKLQFLENQGAGLKNVLIICDPQLLAQTRDVESHLFRKDPRLTGELPFRFQLSFFRAYLARFFFFHYWKLKLTGQVTPDWSVNVAYTYLDTRVRQDLVCAGSPLVCYDNPITTGTPVLQVPANSAFVWTSYKPRWLLRGLAVAGGFTYQDGYHVRYTTTGTAPNLVLTRDAQVPSTFSLDGLVQYEVKRWRVALNLYNLTDRLNYAQSFGNRAAPAQGRTAIVSVGMSF